MVSSCLLISKYSSSFNNPLVTLPRAPSYICFSPVRIYYCLVWVTRLMAYHPSRVISCHGCSFRRTAVKLFNPRLRGLGGLYFCQEYWSKIKVVAQLEFELAFNDFAVQLVRHYASGTTPIWYPRAKKHPHIRAPGVIFIHTLNS